MIVNGEKKDVTGNRTQADIKGATVDLTLAFKGEGEAVDLKFKWKDAPEGLTIESEKIGNRIVTSIKKGKQVLYENLTAQATFAVLHAEYGWSTGKSNGVYVKSNTLRKEGKKAAEKVVK